MANTKIIVKGRPSAADRRAELARVIQRANAAASVPALRQEVVRLAELLDDAP
jgi:hypothetical protein